MTSSSFGCAFNLAARTFDCKSLQEQEGFRREAGAQGAGAGHEGTGVGVEAEVDSEID